MIGPTGGSRCTWGMDVAFSALAPIFERSRRNTFQSSFKRMLLRCHRWILSSSTRTEVLNSRLIVSRSRHCQPHRSPTEQQPHELCVSHIDGFRCISSAQPSHFASSGHLNTRRDVVVCLGWMGCKDRHLDNVVSFY